MFQRFSVTSSQTLHTLVRFVMHVTLSGLWAITVQRRKKWPDFTLILCYKLIFTDVGSRVYINAKFNYKSLNAQKVTQNSDVHYELWSPLLSKLWWLCSISFFYLIGTNDLALHLNFYWFYTWDNFSIKKKRIILWRALHENMSISNGNENFLNCLNKKFVFVIYQEHVALCIEASFKALMQFLMILEVK